MLKIEIDLSVLNFLKVQMSNSLPEIITLVEVIRHRFDFYKNTLTEGRGLTCKFCGYVMTAGENYWDNEYAEYEVLCAKCIKTLVDGQDINDNCGTTLNYEDPGGGYRTRRGESREE